MRFAIRVEEAMESEKGSWYVTEASVARMLCAASASGPKRLDASVRISNARYSASIMIIPGTARRIIVPGNKPHQLPFQKTCGRKDRKRDRRKTHPSS